MQSSRHRLGRRRRAAVAATAALLAGGLLTATLPPSPAAATGGCRTGTVSLTFDDGPRAGTTIRLVGILRSLRVPATFFMVGANVAARPVVARRVERAGFLVANHSYSHADMRTQSAAAVAASLNRTDAALRHAGTHPTRLMRPPYGSLDDAARAGIRRAGLRPVLWDVDPRDWSGGSSGEIAARILAGLRPHARNIVLQHDGVANSPASVAAVPRVVREARRRGYCFVALDEQGRPGFPTPVAGLGGPARRVAEGDRARLTVRLSKPAARDVSVGVALQRASAQAADATLSRSRVVVPAGRLSAAVTLGVRRDGVDEPDERLSVRLTAPTGVRIGDAEVPVVLLDRDPPPRVSTADRRVAEPVAGQATVNVPFVLDRRSEKQVRLRVRTVPGTADANDYRPVDIWLRLAPGTRRAVVPVAVLADTQVEPTETFTVRLVEARNARRNDAVSSVAISPPPAPTPTGADHRRR